MKLGFVVEYCKRPDETDQLDKVLQLSVCILVFTLHVSDVFLWNLVSLMYIFLLFTSRVFHKWFCTFARRSRVIARRLRVTRE